jgi:FkbM family methyltransferase
MYFSGYLKCGKATTKTDQNMTIFQFLKVVRKTFLTPLKVRKSYSQCAEDLIVDDLLKSSIKSGADGFYVDVGCHHPKRGSNTYRLYKSGWRGILVDMEDDKVLAAKLARPRDIVVKAAVSDKEEKVNIFSPSAFSTNATISNEVYRNNTNYKSTSSIVTKRLDKILRDNGCPQKIDFMSIDAEGNDFKVLKSFSLDEFQPQVICVENHCVQGGVDKLLSSAIHKLLSTKAYSLCGISGPSTIYKSAS